VRKLSISPKDIIAAAKDLKKTGEEAVGLVEDIIKLFA
jgi:hypothetical protein